MVPSHSHERRTAAIARAALVGGLISGLCGCARHTSACEVRAEPEQEMLVCGSMIGAAGVGDPKVVPSDAMTAAALAGFERQMGKPRASAADTLEDGSSKVAATRYEFSDAGEHVAWVFPQPQGTQVRLEYCLGSGPIAAAKRTCESMLSRLRTLRPAKLEPNATPRPSAALPSIRGRALLLPAGCDLASDDSIECDEATLTVETGVEPTLKLDDIIEAYDRSLRAHGAVSRARRRCLLDSTPIDCWWFHVDPGDGHKMQVLFGELVPDSRHRIEVHCTATDVDFEVRMPAPCDQVLELAN